MQKLCYLNVLKFSKIALAIFAVNTFALPTSTGGTQVNFSEYPFVTMVINIPKGKCQGTFIDPQTVITAAHCVMNPADPSKIFVYARPSAINPDASANRLSIKTIKIHPQFVKGEEKFDVALLKLEHPVTLRPLPSYHLNEAVFNLANLLVNKATAQTYSVKYFGLDRSDRSSLYIHQGTSDVYTSAACINKLRTVIAEPGFDPNTKNEIESITIPRLERDKNKVFCVLQKRDLNNIQGSPGDSGGVLISKENLDEGYNVVQGVLSIGRLLSGSTVYSNLITYSNIFNYADFIKENTASKAVFFFDNGTFGRYDVRRNSVDPDGPKDITNSDWYGLQTYAQQIKTSVRWYNDYIYILLNNNRYLRYNLKTNAVDPGYPVDISTGNWGAIIAARKNDLIAAFSYDGFAYFFLNDGYCIRMNMQTEETDLPVLASTYWPGLYDYASRISSVLNYENEYIYFFLNNNTYVRFNVLTNRIDVGPLQTSSLWPRVYSNLHKIVSSFIEY